MIDILSLAVVISVAWAFFAIFVSVVGVFCLLCFGGVKAAMWLTRIPSVRIKR